MNTSGDHPVCNKCNVVMESGVAYGSLMFASDTNNSQSGFFTKLKMDHKPHPVQVVAYRCANCGNVRMNSETLRPLVVKNRDDGAIY